MSVIEITAISTIMPFLDHFSYVHNACHQISFVCVLSIFFTTKALGMFTHYVLNLQLFPFSCNFSNFLLIPPLPVLYLISYFLNTFP